MRFSVLVLSAALAASPAAVLAQAPPLPESRALQQGSAISRSIDAQQRNLQQSQQNQFEVNQLRGEIQRQNTLGPIPPAGCSPGALRC